MLTLVVKEQNRVLAETRAEAKAKDAEMKAMQEKVAKLESILTNLALDNSASSQAKVSMK